MIPDEWGHWWTTVDDSVPRQVVDRQWTDQFPEQWTHWRYPRVDGPASIPPTRVDPLVDPTRVDRRQFPRAGGPTGGPTRVDRPVPTEWTHWWTTVDRQFPRQVVTECTRSKTVRFPDRWTRWTPRVDRPVPRRVDPTGGPTVDRLGFPP
jgi:hypothetical protein